MRGSKGIAERSGKLCRRYGESRFFGVMRHNLLKIDVCEIPSTRYRCSSEALLCLRNAADLPQAPIMASFTHGRWVDRINPASACVYSVQSGTRHFFIEVVF